VKSLVARPILAFARWFVCHPLGRFLSPIGMGSALRRRDLAPIHLLAPFALPA
jgi:hypothetical protein